MHVLVSLFFFLFKHKTAYDMRISDWSSDVCSSDLPPKMGLLYPQSPKLPMFRMPSLLVKPLKQLHCPSFRLHSPRPLHSKYSFVPLDRKSVVSGKSVSVRVALGGRSIIKKKHHFKYK